MRTATTPSQNVAVSLLKAQIDMNKSDPLYLTQDLSQVYTDMDPRTYELSSYSYMILPTDTTLGMTTAKGYTLGAFGSYLLCQGQQQVDALGYSALPINLVEAGYQQLQKIPGNQVPTATSAQIQGCNNPTFSTNGTNTLADTDPNPPACDKKGTTQCSTGTGGAKTSTPVNPSAQGNQPSSGTSAGTSNGSSSASAHSSTAPGSNEAAQGCNPDTGTCGNGTNGTANGPATVNGIATSAAVSLGNGLQVSLMVLAAALLLCLALVPPLIAQASRRRRQRRFGPPPGPGAFR
jgi:hypothetical protein